MNQQDKYVSEGHGAAADEVSLRDLYLIIRKAFPWIVGSAILAGALVFAYLSFQPEVYRAESTTLVTPLVASPSFSLGGEDTLTIATGAPVPFETYETLAMSRAVMEKVLQSVPGFTDGVTELSRSLTLERLVGPDNPTQVSPLAVIHAASSTTPELAAELADAWALATVETVRASLLDDLRPLSQTTGDRLESAETEVREIEAVLRDFNAANDRNILQGELSAASSELIAAEQQLRSLNSRIVMEQAELEVLQRQFVEEQSVITSTDATSNNFLSGLTLQEATEFIDEQRQIKRAAYLQARDDLREFDRLNNTTLLSSRLDQITDLITSRSANLFTMDTRLDMLQANLEIQMAELAQQPERLVLLDSLLDNPLLLESLRDADGTLNLDQDAMAVGSEVLNPLHSRLLGDTLSTRLAIAELESDREILAATLDDLNAERTELRNELIDINRERSLLELALDEASSDYSGLTGRSQQLLLASSRPDAAQMVIREGGGALEGLRTRIREVERTVATLDAQIRQVNANRLELQEMVAELRDRIATMGQEQTALNREVDQARAALSTVARMQPLVDFFSQLAPGNARVMNEAVVPLEPESGRLLPTVIAVVVVGLLATVFAFLREAVRDPGSGSSSGQGQVVKVGGRREEAAGMAD